MIFIFDIAWTLLKMVIKTNVLSIEKHKSFQMHYSLWEKFFKHILACLYCRKYNEINISHSGVQKHVSCNKWHKYLYITSHNRFLIYYGLCLEMAGNVVSVVFYGLFLF